MAFTGGRNAGVEQFPAPSDDLVYQIQCADDHCGGYGGLACTTRKGTLRKTPHPVRVADAAAEAARPACVCTHDVTRTGCWCPASEPVTELEKQWFA
jgi:hypothetical protein